MHSLVMYVLSNKVDLLCETSALCAGTAVNHGTLMYTNYLLYIGRLPVHGSHHQRRPVYYTDASHVDPASVPETKFTVLANTTKPRL